MREEDHAGVFAGRVATMFGAQVVGAGVGVLNGILLARLLGPAGKGDYYLLVLLPATALILLQFGLPYAFNFFTARGLTRGLIARSLLLTATLSAIGFVGLAMILPALQGAVLQGGSPELVWLAFLGLPLSLLATFTAAIVMGRQAVRWYAAINVVNPVLTTVLLVIVLWGLAPSVLGAIAVYLTGAAINTLLYLAAAARVSRAVPEPAFAPLRQLVRYGLQFYPTSLAGFFSNRVDVYLIAFLITDPSEALGYYTMAVGLAEMVYLLERSVGQVYFPHVAGSNRQDADRRVALVSRVTLLSAGVFALLLIPAALLLIGTLLPAFGPSIPPMLVLLPGVAAMSASNVIGGYVAGIDRPGVASTVTVIAFVVNIAANLVLIPRFGILGAALASLISYSLSWLLLTVMASRFSGAFNQGVLAPRGPAMRNSSSPWGSGSSVDSPGPTQAHEDPELAIGWKPG